MKGPHEKDPNGGDYWRQGVFYKILVDNYGQKDWKVISTGLILLNRIRKRTTERKTGDQCCGYHYGHTADHRYLAKIQDHDFYTGCGKEDCHWCNFVKTNNLAVSFT